MTKWVYRFGCGAAEGLGDLRNLLGGKGAGLAEMSNLGLPVPPGFTITTEVCTHFYANGKTYPSELKGEVTAALAEVERAMDARFGDPDQPLLVSVRSGARASMPGMMDTVLNLGLNDATVEGLARRSGDERFAYDSYRRFLQMYGQVVLDIEHHHFEELIENHKIEVDAVLDTELGTKDWKQITAGFKEVLLSETGKPFPQDPQEQLWDVIAAVFGSWMNARAVTYRRLHNLPTEWGTAVNVQAMVFGNMGEDCATGVAFTRNPSTGANEFYGEYLVNAQGEDVVAGIRTPQQLTIAGKQANKSTLPAMEKVMPEVFGELLKVRQILEDHYRDMQDIEFTIERGKLWMLQTRTGARSALASVVIAVALVKEGKVGRHTALSRIDPNSLEEFVQPTIVSNAQWPVIARGLPAAPGAVSGRVVFSACEAQALAARGERVILVQVETRPEDIDGIQAARGIVTTRGGMTSHASVIARGMGRPCVAGAGDLRIADAQTMSVRNHLVRAGDLITINGSTGEVLLGEVPTVRPLLSGDFATLMGWADELRSLKVRANAETPADVRAARDFGAEGIGLARTEHMFFGSDRIGLMREMIIADEERGRRAALAKLLPMQRHDFTEIFRIMKGLPVTIRLLDPPLHEFLPKTDAEFEELAQLSGKTVGEVRYRTHTLHETNPMLGHRGCRLGITYPEIYETQAIAIFEAAVAVERETGETVEPEIMMPLIATKQELDILKAIVDRVAGEVTQKTGVKIPYLVGTMIELPRAALMAGEIAEIAEFFSFGTNVLTQTVFGVSRNDATSFLAAYQKAGIFARDPFVTIDTEGVGEMVKIAADRGRNTRPDIKLGICGEHGGDPASIHFCREVALDYVSCSPFRVPMARLTAAQAELLFCKV